MVIELLPALVTAIRAAAIANDNAPPAAGPETPEPPPGPPLVRTLRCRPGVTYARSANVILPLVFAVRMPGWRATRA